MNTKKLAREIAAIISTHDNKDQYGNAKLAEYIVRKVRKALEPQPEIISDEYSDPKVCPLCQCNHPEMTCEEFANMPVYVPETNLYKEPETKAEWKLPNDSIPQLKFK